MTPTHDDKVKQQREESRRQQQHAPHKAEKSEAAQKEEYEQAKRTGRTFDDFDTWKTKEAEATKVRQSRAPEKEKELTREEHVERVVANFQHGLNHNNPRTQAELNELRLVLGIKPNEDKLSDEQRSAFTGTVVQREPNDELRAHNIEYELEPGVIVPPTQRLADVPASLTSSHQQWKGHQYFLAGADEVGSKKGEGDHIVIVDRDRKIVAVVGTDGSAKVDKQRADVRPGVDGTQTRAVNRQDDPVYRQPL